MSEQQPWLRGGLLFTSLSRVLSRTLLAGSVTLLAACGGSDTIETPEPQVTAFAPNGEISANVRWTDYGVPYVKANNYESLGFGVGYAFANDNICVLADQIIKFNSERARYFGPDEVAGSGDSGNVINDFGYLALGIRANAEAGFPQMSEKSQALLTGYARGYNHYLSTTGSANIDPTCAGQPWVQPITAIDMMTYAQGVALLPGASNFTGAVFVAVPPNTSYLPNPVAANGAPIDASTSPDDLYQPKLLADIGIPDTNPTEAGSNGWAIGSDLSASGNGMLIANPHFPHTGNQRFWQFGTEIPGELKVVGGSLSGMPGIVNIGFNEDVAWTHTFSTAARFVLHRLELDPSDPLGRTYIVDGERKKVQTKTHQIEVATGPTSTATLEKVSYHSEFGPMIVIPGQLPWGQDQTGQQVAYAIYDANLPNYDVFDHWLAMNRAGSISEYQQTFTDYTGIVFNNAIAADKAGNTFFTDGSSVPDINPEAIADWAQDPLYQQLTQAAGLPIFPGNEARFKARGTVPTEAAPRLARSDFVQNSNDSFWLTNPAEPITQVSPLFGPVGNQQSLRSRLGQKMLAEGGSVDGLFTLDDLQDRLLGNRNFLGEAVYDDLLAACQARGTTPVATAAGTVSIAPACAALAQWNGVMDKGSIGAMVFREFASEFSRNPQWQVAYDPTNPVTTPNTLAANETVLEQLAAAMVRIQSAGLALDAPLGDVQFVERSLPDGTPSGVKLPWGGANNVEGGFNVFRANTGGDGSLLPRHIYPLLPGSNLSAEAAGYHITYGSSWMFTMEFTEEGPVANGLLSYSQSRNVNSAHNLDQTEFYSVEPRLRPIYFTEADIAGNTIEEIDLNVDALGN